MWRERDWVLARIAEKPDLTLRALLRELADRGLVVSYYALWHFLQLEELKPHRRLSLVVASPSHAAWRDRGLAPRSGRSGLALPVASAAVCGVAPSRPISDGSIR